MTATNVSSLDGVCGVYLRAVQFHPAGVNSNSFGAPERAPHVGPQHVWCLPTSRNQENPHPENVTALCRVMTCVVLVQHSWPGCFGATQQQQSALRAACLRLVSTTSPTKSETCSPQSNACPPQRAVIFIGWVFFLISLGGQAPHVCLMGVHRTRGSQTKSNWPPSGPN